MAPTTLFGPKLSRYMSSAKTSWDTSLANSYYLFIPSQLSTTTTKRMRLWKDDYSILWSLDWLETLLDFLPQNQYGMRFPQPTLRALTPFMYLTLRGELNGWHKSVAWLKPTTMISKAYGEKSYFIFRIL